MTPERSVSDPLTLIPSPDTLVGRTVHERVRAAIRQAVIAGALPPLYHLRQTDLARALRVSVTPVREALRDLAAEGLVQLDAHRGAIVAQFALADFVEIRMLLDSLWTLLARLAAERITEPEIAQLWDLQHRIEADPSTYMQLNPVFHRLIRDSARSARIAGVLEGISASAERVVGIALGGAAPHRLGEGITEHRDILAALEAHDGDAMIRAVLAHNHPTWDAVEALIREQEASS